MIPKRSFEIVYGGLHFGAARTPYTLFPPSHRSSVYVSIASRHRRHDNLYRGYLRYRAQCLCSSCSTYRYTSHLLFLFLVPPAHRRPHVSSPIGSCQLPVSRFPLTSDIIARAPRHPFCRWLRGGSLRQLLAPCPILALFSIRLPCRPNRLGVHFVLRLSSGGCVMYDDGP